MSLFDRFRKTKEPQDLLGPRTASPQTHLTPLAFGPSNAGIMITEEKALTIGSVYAAVSRISRDIASLPLHLYDGKQSDRRLATWRSEYRILNEAPNDYQTAYQFRQAMAAAALLWGNAFAEIERNLNGEPVALHFIDPARVQIKLDPQERGVLYQVDSGTTLRRGSMLHLTGFSCNSVSGVSVVRNARETFGLTAAAESYGAAYFGNGAAPGGVLKTDKQFRDPIAIQRLRDTWNNNHQGPTKSGGVAVLEEGMDYQQIGIPPEDSQFLETRQFQVEEVARWFGLPPAMLGVTENTSQYKNLHEQIMFYTRFTLRPWLESFEASFAAQLIPPALRGTLYYEHDMDALLRADVETRYRVYETALRTGIMSRNEVRKKENMPPIPGGDDYGGGADA